jgi:hypothetical protein
VIEVLCVEKMHSIVIIICFLVHNGVCEHYVTVMHCDCAASCLFVLAQHHTSLIDLLTTTIELNAFTFMWLILITVVGIHE